jgi:hypothetical protein
MQAIDLVNINMGQAFNILIVGIAIIIGKKYT